jgi:hypothetical protein
MTTPELLIFNQRQAAGVEEQPRADITNWRILEYRPTPESLAAAPSDEIRADMQEIAGARFLFGWLPGRESIRITTAIADFNAPARLLTTQSGRVYEIQGPPTTDPERLALIHVHAAIKGMHADVVKDVSDDLWNEIMKAAH